jgi:hypothetical protein
MGIGKYEDKTHFAPSAAVKASTRGMEQAHLVNTAPTAVRGWTEGKTMAKMNPSKLRNVLEALPSCDLSNTKKEAIEAIITKYLEGDIVPVVRCKDCLYYHKPHVLCYDGTEKDYSEFPPEAFVTIGWGVNGDYGINIGGKCEKEKNAGYRVDKSVFRQPGDFCSYGERE